MSTIKIVRLISSIAASLAVVCVAAALALSQTDQGTVLLSGTVRSGSGNPLEGVAVSARAAAQTFTTTVYTDVDGEYVFPPLEAGHYRLWAQAIGFEADKKQANPSGEPRQNVDFTLTPLDDFHRQLSGAEWMASLPENNPSDLRMKAILMSNCTGCHDIGFAIQNRFDNAGWHAILNVMSRIEAIGVVPQNSETDAVIKAYEDELAAYLDRVRGSAPSALKPAPFSRVTGGAARIVVTEYSLSRPDMPGWVMKHDGSDWSEGTPSRWDGRAAHDVAIDSSGYVWFADDSTPERTIGRLNPRTGKVTDYKLAGQSGAAESSHAIALDLRGNVWFANDTEGNPSEFDPKTEKFRRFPRPSGFVPSGNFITVDAQGNAWAPTPDGAYKIDAYTGEYTKYAGNLPGRANYDISIDKDGNAWVAQPGGNRMAIVDSKTGKVDQLSLGPRRDIEVTSKDREISSTLNLTSNTATPLERGPRRVAADKNGDFVWVCEFFADKIARINIHTREIKEYPLPHRYTHPYAITVDRNHIVWMTMLNADRIAKFDPRTEQFTEYPLPTLGTEARHIQVDSSTDPPTVWVPYGREAKIARIQFRSNAAKP